MEYILDRQVFTPESTIGQWMTPEGVREFWTLEDVDRGLQDTMTEEEIAAVKVYGRTAIPYGTYEIKITYSPRFEMETPLLEAVKGFSHIRVHSGATAEHTEGCVLTGQDRGQNVIYHGRRAFNLFMPRLRAVLAVERCFVRITKLHFRIDPITNAILTGEREGGATLPA